MGDSERQFGAARDIPADSSAKWIKKDTVSRENSKAVFHTTHWKRELVEKIYPYTLLLVDVIVITVLFSVALVVRYDIGLLEALSRRVLVVIIGSSVVGMYLIGGYNYRTDKRSFRFASEHLVVSFCVFVGVFFLIYSFVSYGYQIRSSRSTIAFTLLVFPACSLCYRFALGQALHALQGQHILCLIGAGEAAVDVFFRMRRKHASREIAVFAGRSSGRVGRHLVPGDETSPLVSSFDDVGIHASLQDKYVEGLVITQPLSELPEEISEQFVKDQFRGQRIYTYETFLSQELSIIPPSELSPDWAFSEGFLLNRSLAYDRAKRVSDIFLSFFGLIMAAPALVAAALLVRVTSKGPVIFKQQRVGKGGKVFTLYKFRSMQVGSEKGEKYTQKDDARLTPVGGFLRRFRLDELPQFWNVFRGDLSLIGPRAEWVDLVREYEKKFPYYHFRHAIKPGITGWAQVNHSYGQSDYDTLEKLYYDLYYVRRFSLVLDLIIIVKTFYMMLFGRGQ